MNIRICWSGNPALVLDVAVRSRLISLGKQAETNLNELWRLISPASRDFTSAALLLKEDRAKESGKMDWQLPCDKRTAAILGRDSVWVDLARVKQIKGEEGEYVVVDYESLKALKGGNIRLSNIYHRSELAHAVITDSEGPQHLSRVGSERILFMDNLLDKPDAVFQCAVMPNTPDFITATLEGIAADRSATIGQE
jgi:hypothetical protein